MPQVPSGQTSRDSLDTSRGLSNNAVNRPVVLESPLFHAGSGVKLAFLITHHYMEEQSVYKVTSAEMNVTFDPATFTPRAEVQR